MIRTIHQHNINFRGLPEDKERILRIYWRHITEPTNFLSTWHVHILQQNLQFSHRIDKPHEKVSITIAKAKMKWNDNQRWDAIQIQDDRPQIWEIADDVSFLGESCSKMGQPHIEPEILVILGQANLFSQIIFIIKDADPVSTKEKIWSTQFMANSYPTGCAHQDWTTTRTQRTTYGLCSFVKSHPIRRQKWHDVCGVFFPPSLLIPSFFLSMSR